MAESQLADDVAMPHPLGAVLLERVNDLELGALRQAQHVLELRRRIEILEERVTAIYYLGVHLRAFAQLLWSQIRRRVFEPFRHTMRVLQP